MNPLFEERMRSYFDDAEAVLSASKGPCSQGFFLNTKKADQEKIFSLIDFPYEKSELSKQSFIHHEDNIGKTIAYELGLIYPQEIAASLTSYFIEDENEKLIVDMCAAPGGKTINILNRLNEGVLCISNDITHNRALVLSSNLERMGLDRVVITNKRCEDLAGQLQGNADLVILDAPCSGEGMIRKYPEILDTYSVENIRSLAALQKDLLDEAYEMLKGQGRLVYSTCTFAFEEDEEQIASFLERHPDMEILPVMLKSRSKMEGTVKLTFSDQSEGQFFCIMRKNSETESKKLKELPNVRNRIVDCFIEDNLDIDRYFLYRNNDRFYLSLDPLPDLKDHVLRYGIYIGDLVRNRFEPSHHFYRANSLKGRYRYVYDLNEKEYEDFISGKELKADLDDHYYLITYQGISLGYGKCAKGTIKNKYPKGLRRMV